MSNRISISGYAKFLKSRNNVTEFSLSVYRGKKEEEKEKYFNCRVKMFGKNPGVRENSEVAIVDGRLDAHKYNDRMVYEILCDEHDVFIRGKYLAPTDNELPAGYPFPQPPSGIPFDIDF